MFPENRASQAARPTPHPGDAQQCIRDSGLGGALGIWWVGARDAISTHSAWASPPQGMTSRSSTVGTLHQCLLGVVRGSVQERKDVFSTIVEG